MGRHMSLTLGGRGRIDQTIRSKTVGNRSITVYFLRFLGWAQAGGQVNP